MLSSREGWARPPEVGLRDEHVAHGQHAQAAQLLGRVEHNGREPARHLGVQADLDPSLDLEHNTTQGMPMTMPRADETKGICIRRHFPGPLTIVTQSRYRFHLQCEFCFPDALLGCDKCIELTCQPHQKIRGCLF